MKAGRKLCPHLREGVWENVLEIKIKLWSVMTYAMAAQSKALVCGRSPAKIVGSNPTEAWMFVCCDCCVLSGRGLCDGLITPPEKSHRLWCVVVCDLETAWMRRPWSTEGCRAKKKDLSTTDSRMEVKRNAYSVLEGKSAGKRQLERPRSRRVT
jgi:hypothetical protein